MAESRFKPGPATAVSEAECKLRENHLRTALLRTQQRCRLEGKAVIILVSGVEAAGRSEVVNRISEWLDMRNVRALSYWHETDEERHRPRNWRYWRDLPGKGEVTILFNSWYLRTIDELMPDRKRNEKKNSAVDSAEQLQQQCEHINRFEKLLTDDGVILIKLWFHIGYKAQKKRLQKKIKSGHYINQYESMEPGYYERFVAIAEQLIEATDSDCAGWHIIQADDARRRDLQAGETLLQCLQQDAARHSPAAFIASSAGRLQQIELQSGVSSLNYKKKLERYQRELNELHWRRWDRRRSTVILFEGWDAAGKGGAIRRLTAALDARLYRVIPIAAPTDEERAHHYLWRFWRQLPQDGFITIYDRSWYGRVLVERVEGFASDLQWQNAYAEINDFEQQLSSHGIRVIKFWLHISPHEQLRRFKMRQQSAHKQHKISDEDWRNRERWSEYEQALEDMLEHTSSAAAPWHVIAANNKKCARLEILKTVCMLLQ